MVLFTGSRILPAGENLILLYVIELGVEERRSMERAIKGCWGPL